MEKIKTILHYLSSMLLYALLMILFIVVLMVAITIGDRVIAAKNHQSKAPLFSAYVIISPSMVPNINVYDAVITARVPQNRIKMYDVITFLSKEIETHGVPITHRVVGILKTEEGERAYRTKGDNNNNEDKAIILQSEVIGKVLFRIPMLGYVRTFVTSKIGFLISVVLPITASLFLEIWRLIHKRKAKLKEKQQENQIENPENILKQEDLPTVFPPSLGNVEPVSIMPPPIQESAVSQTTSSPITTLQSEPIKVESPSVIPTPPPVNIESQPVASPVESVKVASPPIVNSLSSINAVTSSPLAPPPVKVEPQPVVSPVESVKVAPPPIVNSLASINVETPSPLAPTPVKVDPQPVVSPVESVKVELPPIVDSPSSINVAPSSPLASTPVKVELQSDSKIISDIPKPLDSMPTAPQPKKEDLENTVDDDDIEVI